MSAPRVTCVVAAHDLRRELPRTVQSLAPPYQRGLAPADVEILVADNGSPEPVDGAWFEGVAAHVRVLRSPPGNASPCAALNAAVADARAPLVAVFIDGARMASPGLLARALEAMRIADDAFVATMGFHLGFAPQQHAQLYGYDAAEEDRLLATIAWRDDGYRLFEICARAESYAAGVLADFPETTAFVVRRATFERIGGFDARFRYRGGGLANFEFYDRVFADPRIEPIVLIGEGTFHQVHDGNTTRAGGVLRRETPDGSTIWEAMTREFVAITGRAPLSQRRRKPALYGRCETAAAERQFFGEGAAGEARRVLRTAT